MILIIGAGMAGVTLARFLSSRNIPFRIFDQQAEFKNQGFGLTLRADTTQKLLPLLGLEEQEFGTSVAVDRRTGRTNTFLADVETGARFAAASFKEGASARDWRTNRERLRGAILGDVAGRVEYGCKMASFTRTSSGVRVVFENGMDVEGTVLVAADGVHSSIRSKLLPQCVPQDWDGVMLNGTCRFGVKEWNQKIAPHIGDVAVYPGFADQKVLAITIYDADWDLVEGYVDVSWGYSRRRRVGHDPLFVRYADRSFDKAKAPEAFWDEIAALPAGLVEPFRTVFEGIRERGDRTIHHQLVSLLVPKEDLLEKLHSDRVVFIGDSVHDWSNHAGTAANAAIQDALALGEVLDGKKALEAYYEERYPAWLGSYDKNGEDFQALHRPLKEWKALLDHQKMDREKAQMYFHTQGIVRRRIKEHTICPGRCLTSLHRFEIAYIIFILIPFKE
ncbi:FAD/NAD(P)-binding domain-containing protein [Paraphaeosphaeria sporulosa]|uniref:FAD/NAD(P)-binding domain-containing protein n=1 Tax=Paraphaeosphaeria sporulosa TaxID=1460663 RepID=A0A177CMJ0_9PLEO|nr:FAD/NAD(P)-binding domain-containing protein [Paraphaeosphaeria sporulosa]OAG07977.1 FAD/NAD(P)-binding domain-containing protein [Paraphaeosphaeria sporulosa]